MSETESQETDAPPESVLERRGRQPRRPDTCHRQTRPSTGERRKLEMRKREGVASVQSNQEDEDRVEKNI